MSCINPLLISVEGIDSSGREILRLDNPYFTNEGYKVKNLRGSRRYTVPCGHCLQCRKAQARMWSNRLMMEMHYHDSSYFVTLTYDDLHIPVSRFLSDETGEVAFWPTLRKRDVQLFFKRLRKRFSMDKIRYYIAGEYGPSTQRPHYHSIIFGLHLDDLQPFGMSETGNQYFISQSLSDVWPYGFLSVEPANEYTCLYTCQYVTSKLGLDPNQIYLNRGQEPPFALCSRKPGIGVQFMIDHKDEILKYDRIYLQTENGGLSFKPPRYFYQEILTPEEYEPIRNKHLAACIDNVSNLEDFSDLDIFSQNDIKELFLLRGVSLRDRV